MLALWGGTGVAALRNILQVSPSSGVSRHSGRSIHERGDSPSLGVQDFTSMGGSSSRLSITKGNAEALGPAGGICQAHRMHPPLSGARAAACDDGECAALIGRGSAYATTAGRCWSSELTCARFR